jgi:hypothetical protein
VIPIKSLEEFQRIIDNQWVMTYKTMGSTYRLDMVTALNLKVIELITMIRDRIIFYQPE